MKAILFDLWLSLAVTPGSATFGALLTRFHSAEEIHLADEKAIAAVIGSRSSDYAALLDKDLGKAKEILTFCEEHQVGLLSYFDPAFPPLLAKIPCPPVLLYYRGRLPDFSSKFFAAVVGTRHLSDYGRKTAFRTAFDLARAGAVIVSGMAIGIDGVAMAGALSAGGTAIAFLGSGINVCYPAAHQPLARETVRYGCIFSEFPPGTRPLKHHFPIRNRLISGLSHVTVVIEGKEHSGSLITARYAKNQDRPVYALPGKVDDHRSDAANLLIREGAKLFLTADDIVRDFDKMLPGLLDPFRLSEEVMYDLSEKLAFYKVSAITPDDPIFPAEKPVRRQSRKPENTRPKAPAPKVGEKKQAPDLSGLSPSEISLYQSIPEDGGCIVDDLVSDDLPLRILTRQLLTLEMRHLVDVLPGGRIRRSLK